MTVALTICSINYLVLQNIKIKILYYMRIVIFFTIIIRDFLMNSQ